MVRKAIAEDAAVYDANRFVLAHGAAHRPEPRPGNVEPGARHDSFRNAYRLARARGLRYCEGFTLPRGYDDRPNRHAWCLDADGTVVDPSPGWADPGGPLRDCYFGVEIPRHLAERDAGAEQGPAPKGVLYELTGRMGLLATELGVEPV